MDASDLPARFNIPFADSAGGSYIRPVPQASQIGIQNGAASLTDGFPPDTFTPVSAGGVPPFGQDMNGILKQITQWAQWQAAGGPQFYDVTFATDIGGYPKGAILASTSNDGTLWLNTVDDNITDPDGVGTANWLAYVKPAPLVVAQGTLLLAGTQFKLKWQTVSVAQPSGASDLFTGGFAATNLWSWDTPFDVGAIASVPSYPVVANGNCTFGVAENTSAAGGKLWTTSAQNLRAIGNTLILGFGI